jgi:hypothetical protein
MSPVGLRSEKGCAGKAQQQLYTTDTTSRQRGRPIVTNPQLSKDNLNERENKMLSWAPQCSPDIKTDWLTDRRL